MLSRASPAEAQVFTSAPAQHYLRQVARIRFIIDYHHTQAFEFGMLA